MQKTSESLYLIRKHPSLGPDPQAEIDATIADIYLVSDLIVFIIVAIDHLSIAVGRI